MNITCGTIFHTYAGELWLVALSDPNEEGLFDALDEHMVRTTYHVGEVYPALIPAADLMRWARELASHRVSA
jgi:hypothetical protein